MRCTAAVIPAVERGLTRARDRERTVRYVLGDRGAGRGEHAVAQLDGETRLVLQPMKQSSPMTVWFLT